MQSAFQIMTESLLPLNAHESNEQDPLPQEQRRRMRVEVLLLRSRRAEVVCASAVLDPVGCRVGLTNMGFHASLPEFLATHV